MPFLPRTTGLSARLVRHGRRKAIGLCAAAALLMASLTLPDVAQAEGKIRIVNQFGIVYLLLNIAQDQGLIEKHGKADGLDIDVEFVRLSGATAVNDALLSNSVDIVGAGVGALFTVWDRTRERQNIKGLASLGNFPFYLVSINPEVKTIADFTEKDRIALPAVIVSGQSRVLQLASAKLWGDEHYNRLDKLQVQLAHPVAAATLISGGTEINAHFGIAPFTEQILARNPAAHIVLSSYEAQGGPATSTLLLCDREVRQREPAHRQAFVAALQEAAEFATRHPEEAVDTFIRVTNSSIERDLILQVVKNPDVRFTTTPHGTLELGQFLHRVGAIKTRPEVVTDYFFDGAHLWDGS